MPSVIKTLFGFALILFFTWKGVSLVSKPEEWLIRYGRDTGERHIRATRFIGWMFLAFVGLVILQLIHAVHIH